MGNKIKTITVVVIIALIIVAVLAITKKNKELQEEIEQLSNPVAVYEMASREVDMHVINEKIQDIGELATIEYLYTYAGKFEDPAKIFGKDIPISITTKSFIAKWDGSIKVGVDISKVTAEVDESTKEIIVHIPKAKILSHEINDESMETLDEKNGMFNKLKVEDIRKFDAISKDAMEQKAIKNGILDEAFENAKEIIYKLIDTDVVEDLEYVITFKVIED